MKTSFKSYLVILVSIFLPMTPAAQTGGQFSLTQSVIAGGGADSSGGNFGVTGTTAQAAAGADSSGGQFSISGGFWQDSFTPTAAQTAVGGRVFTANGAGIRSVRVTMTAPNGQTQSAVTGAFGYFRFEQVPVGETYIFTVYSKRFTFSNGTQILFVTGQISDLVFVADRL